MISEPELLHVKTLMSIHSYRSVAELEHVVCFFFGRRGGFYSTFVGKNHLVALYNRIEGDGRSGEDVSL